MKGGGARRRRGDDNTGGSTERQSECQRVIKSLTGAGGNADGRAGNVKMSEFHTKEE